MVLPRRIYVLTEDVLRALREAGIKFSEVSRAAGQSQGAVEAGLPAAGNPGD
jgi:predicted acylesterase/phospholipase RssA